MGSAFIVWGVQDWVLEVWRSFESCGEGVNEVVDSGLRIVSSSRRTMWFIYPLSPLHDSGIAFPNANCEMAPFAVWVNTSIHRW